MSELRVDPGSTGPAFVSRARPFAWGIASQAASSATNFGLSLVAAIALGPAGLGRVFVGFSFYLLVLGFQRALIIDPLVAASSTLEGDARTKATRAALTMCLVASGASTILGTAAAFLVPGEVGDGVILFVPWLVPSLLQDFWRVILFRDGRGRAAVMNDVLWVAVMGAAVPLLILLDNEWAVVGTWGAGAAAGMMLGFFQTGTRPDLMGRSLRWWRRRAWPLGRWLGAEGIAYTVGSQGLVFVLALILGTRSLGGLRAVQTLFGPLSLLGPAIALPGLPELSRQVRTSDHRARRVALVLGAGALALTGAYVLLAALGGARLIGGIFGEGFGGFSALVWPVAVGQLLTASSLGFALLLKAQQRGRALLWTRVASSGTALTLSAVLAVLSGIEGAAWGMAIGSAASALLVALLAFGGRHPPTTGSVD
jgi:O-antigen/teichoic acid export membrane protein